MPHTAARIFDLVDRIASAPTPADAWDAYLAAGREAGFEWGAALLVSSDAKMPKRCYCASMPEGWLAEYAAQDCERIDPTLPQITGSITPFEFRVADWQGDTARRVWHDLDRDAGLETGLIVPFHADGALRAVALCGREIALAPHDRKALEYAGLETMLRLRALGAKTAAGQEPSLSERERECLQWVAAGKSDWEIGEILDLSVKTVNAYVERAKQKMQASTRTQAIVFALRRGALTP